MEPWEAIIQYLVSVRLAILNFWKNCFLTTMRSYEEPRGAHEEPQGPHVEPMRSHGELEGASWSK